MKTKVKYDFDLRRTKGETMYPSNNKSVSKINTFALSILSGLMALLFSHEAYAQTFGNALATSPTISPASGSKVVAGQTVTVQRVFFGSADPGNSLFRNGEGFLAYPDG